MRLMNILMVASWRRMPLRSVFVLGVLAVCVAASVSPEQRVGVLVYGLIRSDGMLRLTAPSLEEHILKPLGNSTLTFVCAYCTPPLCSVSLSTATLHALSTRIVVLSLPSLPRLPSLPSLPSPASSSAPPWPSVPASWQPAGCRQQRQAAGGGYAAWLNEYAGFLSLLSALRASELVMPAVGTLVVIRVDVRFIPPALDLWVNMPWAHVGRIFVPDMQHFGGVNDRFSYGAREAVRDYIEARWRRMHAPAVRGGEVDTPLAAPLVRAWGVAAYPECIVGERLSCWYATTRNVSIGFSSVRFVRVRSDTHSPDVDMAVANRSMPLRSWFHMHDRLCPSLSCIGGARNASKGSRLGAVCSVR